MSHIIFSFARCLEIQREDRPEREREGESERDREKERQMRGRSRKRKKEVGDIVEIITKDRKWISGQLEKVDNVIACKDDSLGTVNHREVCDQKRRKVSHTSLWMTVGKNRTRVRC